MRSQLDIATSSNYNSNAVSDDLLLFNQQPTSSTNNSQIATNENKLNDNDDANRNDQEDDDDLGVDLSIETSNPDMTFISSDSAKNNDVNSGKDDKDNMKAELPDLAGSNGDDLDTVSSLYNKLLINNNQNVNNDINNECKNVSATTGGFSEVGSSLNHHHHHHQINDVDSFKVNLFLV